MGPLKETWRCETCRVDGMSLVEAMNHLGRPHGFDFHLIQRRIVPMAVVGPGRYEWSFQRGDKYLVEYTRTVEFATKP